MKTKKKPKIYSHSRLSTFEQCPLKFKLRYIDKIIPEIKETIESHLGKTVHETLEWLYTKVKENKIPSIDKIINYYSNKWEERYTPEIKNVKKELTQKDYFNKGVQFIMDYYTKHSPFDDNTIEIEKKIIFNLDEGGDFRVQGYIDRLSHDSEKDEYEIHDYKTANNLPMKEQVDADRQLALYAIAIKELFGKDKKVCLTWHYLAHNKKICSIRTNEQLQELKQETLRLIRQIEATKNFPPYVSKLCDWCEYKKDICPVWNKDSKINKEIIPKEKDSSYLENENNKIKEEEQEELDIW